MIFFASYINLTRIMWDRFTYACLTSHIRIDQSRVTKDGQERTNDQNKSKIALIQYVDLRC